MRALLIKGFFVEENTMATVKQLMDKTAFKALQVRKSNRKVRTDVGKEHQKFARVKAPKV